jgi:predicted ABC-type ATPase
MVAGPNGAGKSTLVNRYTDLLKRNDVPVINPDVIAKDMEPFDPARAALGAGKEALRLQEAFLAEKRSFLVETTFSGKRELELMKRASVSGYKVNCVFVGIDSPDKSAFRVEQRAIRGGHSVPDADVARRYERGLENLAQVISKVDRLYLLDNSGRSHRLILSIENGRRKYISQDVPGWCNALNLPPYGDRD